jgi:GNAT superfamily N-acetyltransferase
MDNKRTDSPKGSITIRKAAVEDALALARLLRGLGFFERLERETLATTQARIARHLEMGLASPNSHTILAAQDEQNNLLGYAAVHWLPYLLLPGPEGYVSELFIAEQARGQGLGSRMLDEIVAEARRRGCFRLQLLNFRSRDSYQRSFYAKYGWQERADAANFVLLL